jgi:hypothetical protein
VVPSRLSRPGWRILGGLALIALLGMGAVQLFGRMDFFRVRAVEVRGARNLRPEAVVRRLPVRRGESIFDDLDPVRRAADLIPGLRSVRVGRRLPGTLVVTVQEIEPVAYVMRRGRLEFVGANGEVLQLDPTVSGPDLPLAEAADSTVAGFLARLRATDAAFFARVVTAGRRGDDIVLGSGSQRYLFRPDAGAEVIRSVLFVEQDLTSNGRAWRELDARFADQIVVRTEAG